MTPSNAELRDLVYRLKYPPSKGAYQVKVDDVMKAVQAREQQLLSELLGKAIEYKAPFYMPSGKAVPVSVIERLQNKTNDGGRDE